MNETQRTAYSQGVCKNNLNLQQFGQRGSTRTFGGSTACAFTILQLLILVWRGIRVTHDQIASVVGYPTAAQKPQYSSGKRIRGPLGLFESQITRIIAYYKIPYTIVHNWKYFDVMRRANLYGPVAIGMMYGWQPEWEGFRYRYGSKTIIADGKPNGIASPRRKAGKTQLAGFETGPHLEVVLGYRVILNSAGAVTRRVVSVKDPNHGSGVRPERPPYDDMTEVQFKNVYQSYGRAPLGRALYAIVPTRVLNK